MLTDFVDFATAIVLTSNKCAQCVSHPAQRKHARISISISISIGLNININININVNVHINLNTTTNTISNTNIIILNYTYKSEYEKVIIPAIKENNIKCVRGDEIYSKQRIMDDIWNSLRNCKLVVAELTGKNPNVMYEIGLAHAIGKPVIIITRNGKYMWM